MIPIIGSADDAEGPCPSPCSAPTQAVVGLRRAAHGMRQVPPGMTGSGSLSCRASNGISINGPLPNASAVPRVLSRPYRSEQIFEIFGKWNGRLGKPAGLLQAMYILYGLPD